MHILGWPQSVLWLNNVPNFRIDKHITESSSKFVIMEFRNTFLEHFNRIPFSNNMASAKPAYL